MGQGTAPEEATAEIMTNNRSTPFEYISVLGIGMGEEDPTT